MTTNEFEDLLGLDDLKAPELLPGMLHGDCIEVMRGMPENSVDSIVTDPPYGLGFMGKKWDALPPGEEWARECLRVLKPGGHLIAFGGSRTWHRLAVAIEDAGFEIRDSLFWHYGSGFPKSQNVSKFLNPKRCRCAVQYNHDNISRKDVRSVRTDLAADQPVSVEAEQDVLEGVRRETGQRREEGEASAQRPAHHDPLRRVREAGEDPAGMGQAEPEHVLLASVQRRSAGQRVGDARSQGGASAQGFHGVEGREEPRMEGRSDAQPGQGELHRTPLREMPGRVEDDGQEGRVHYGAPSSDGSVGRQAATADGSGEPHQPESKGQPQGEPGTVPLERGSQAGGSWPLCAGCGKPEIPDGLGTALKPATEPAVMARKPFTGTVARNVLEHGTGAINIDASRIGTSGGGTHCSNRNADGECLGHDNAGRSTSGETFHSAEPTEALGRFPANLILDEHTAELLDAQSGISKSSDKPRKNSAEAHNRTSSMGKSAGDWETKGHSDSGGASRFFYVAKAPKSERPVVDGVAHATVKPLKLMRYLVSMVTPPGGVVLDPFGGSGTTAEAAMLEGFQFKIIERESDYLPLIRARIERATKTLMEDLL